MKKKLIKSFLTITPIWVVYGLFKSMQVPITNQLVLNQLSDSYTSNAGYEISKVIINSLPIALTIISALIITKILKHKGDIINE